jgi:hypothetical protein
MKNLIVGALIGLCIGAGAGVAASGSEPTKTITHRVPIAEGVPVEEPGTCTPSTRASAACVRIRAAQCAAEPNSFGGSEVYELEQDTSDEACEILREAAVAKQERMGLGGS